MEYCHISISSNNIKSIKSFFLFCFYFKNANSLITKRYFEKKRKNRILTILKSPHINKKAQEQFEQKSFIRNFRIYSAKLPKYLIYLKRIQSYIFSDTHLKIQFFFHSKQNKKIVFYNPNNVMGYMFERTLSKATTYFKIKKLIKTFDIYGELIR